MKITKFVHSCLLIEMPEPINRTALFDPGVMSGGAINIDKLEFLDDIIITHAHADHFSDDLIKKLVAKFPDVHITAPTEVVEMLAKDGITATDQPSDGIKFFDAPHEDVKPFFDQPQEIGIHYLDLLTDPGDSHTFNETKAVLALPVQAPWGSTIAATQLAIKLKPKYVIPIHDWHWHDDAKAGNYANMKKAFNEAGIEFIDIKDGEPVVLDV